MCKLSSVAGYMVECGLRQDNPVLSKLTIEITAWILCVQAVYDALVSDWTLTHLVNLLQN